jgi:ElaB/YqjD/DUF883 family membrane-anchored ribosome-binding protein
MNQSQNTPAGMADRLLGAMKQNPEALLLLAAGCALLVRSTPASGSAARLTGTGETMARASDGVRNYTSDLADQARETVGSYAATASSYADQARRAVGEQSLQMIDQSQQVLRQTQSTVQSTLDRMLSAQPLVVAFAGLAAGAAIAASFPATKVEKDTLGPVGERVTEAAAEMGERLKDAASEATDTLKQSAERRGMTADGLKEMAGEVGDAFSNRMTGGAGQGGSNEGGSGPYGAGDGTRQSGAGLKTSPTE